MGVDNVKADWIRVRKYPFTLPFSDYGLITYTPNISFNSPTNAFENIFETYVDPLLIRRLTLQ